MTNSQLFAIDPLRSAASMLDDAVTAFRNRGHTREAGLEQAALALGLPVHRARSLLFGKIFRLDDDEYRAIRVRFAAFLDEEAEDLARRSERARARRRQMDMDL